MLLFWVFTCIPTNTHGLSMIIAMHVCRHFLVCRLETKGVNRYTKKHLKYMCGNDGLKHLIF
jgi:hypothetical protein